VKSGSADVKTPGRTVDVKRKCGSGGKRVPGSRKKKPCLDASVEDLMEEDEGIDFGHEAVTFHDMEEEEETRHGKGDGSWENRRNCNRTCN